MGLNPISASDSIVKKYLRYMETTFFINDKDYMKQFKKHISKPEHFAKGPYLDFSDSFELGKSINDLMAEGILSEEFQKLYINEPKLLSRSLYKHQELAIRKITDELNLVVSTGTGSGKTESFLLPIVNHLMKEKDDNNLSAGVRALVVYPMNALANDQMKRMRELFAAYPDITFGAYTGETEKDDVKGKAKYMALNNGQQPLPNEKISRNQMKDSPPQILITNYAMLEYLLLRPQDNVFFHGPHSDKWKYIVLDEAHTYTGATGIEVSMLLRRLKNTLSNNNKIKFILTSATLGDEDDNQEICDFASQLCAGAKFDTESIVRAFRYSYFNSKGSKKYPSEIYLELNNLIEENASLEKYKETITKFDSEFTSKSETVPNFLYDFIVQDNLYYEARRVLVNEPATLRNISNELSIKETELVAFVTVASKAEKDNIMLLDARYHMFVRALEGAYLTLGCHKDLSIIPREKTYVNGQEHKNYKISVCRYCGQIYIEATIEGSFLTQKKENEATEKNNFFMLIDGQNHESTDEDIIDTEEEQIYNLCGKCGKIEKANVLRSQMCHCGQAHVVKVKEPIDKKKTLKKCMSCGLQDTQGSVLRGFYLGQEAAASVIGSSLYEEIPSIHVEVLEQTHHYEDDFFGSLTSSTVSVKDVINKPTAKQLLVFSDSRQEAAYFASYFDFTYNNILRRRLFIEALKEVGEYSDEKGIEIKKAAIRLAALLEQHDIVESEISLKEAWKTILYEISSNDRNSLENLGLVSFEYQGFVAPQIGFYKGEEVQAIQRVLANSFKRDCMFDFPLAKEMLKSDKEYYTYKGLECTMSLTKIDKKNNYCKSWISNKNSNIRINYVEKTTGNNKKEINNFLEGVWQRIFLQQNQFYGGLVAKRPNEYIMDISKFKIRTPFTHKMQWYICDKCGKITVNNIKNICLAYRCEGKLTLCDFENEFANNHYRKQYLELDIFPMKVKEHTAQLSPESAKKYQEMFVKKDINVLSCSTTFEMGVDVGELETVFMKNMPPTPANYAQRAGRAGRRKDSVAYSLTFCRLSSHDLTYFNSPIKMIRGKIYPPKFKTENEKIVKRHINAAILAAFWRANTELFKDVGTFFDDDTYTCLLDFIKNLPELVKDYIEKFVPKEVVKQVKLWIEDLVHEDGILNKEYLVYKNELKELHDLKIEALSKSSAGESMGDYIKRIDFYVEKIKAENILAFLSKKNIIPKYGFPVDTVELVTSFDKGSLATNYTKTSKLRLQRDLMIAISEYAPGSEVIADGDMYTSQYIKRPTGQSKVWHQYDFGICPDKKCGHLNIKRHIAEQKEKYLQDCEICSEKVYKDNTFIIPEYGFIISPKVDKSTTKKPKKTYRGEIFYVGDKEEIIENENKEIKINNTIIKIKSTSNDELVVINTSDFYVCDTCGYAKVDEKFKEEFTNDKAGHKNPYGKPCNTKRLSKRTLGHKFKTDVAYISVRKFLDKEKALAVVYCLLEGISQYLGIERNDISGTLHYNKLDSGNWETNFILFDTVPGGAGHVRRIGEADNIKIERMLKKSLEVVKQCNCGEDSNGDSSCYSCLCNYYNQKHHDIIKRKYAIEFLEELLG
ncbi:DEAD/DEAH box helicase [Alkalicella caledoniensis]|uniref:DEAD/DEAH box helicase n=1 Tax=Alkalicella caledoniensis TaxID=2731377 RepID=A0A7G9WB52_ALKCA|nr:DEAD/DEAH box helicase [Alkalicella caledoniensis]QNO15914.1 DEAD/DEAH box helicase [Alkalicella caledoniensis]